MTHIIRTSLPGFEQMRAEDAIRATARHGLSGVNFSSLCDISPSLDPGELQAMNALATELGIELRASVDWINPATARGRSNAIHGGGDLLAGLSRLIRLAKGIGIDEIFFMIGKIEDRFDPATPWTVQLEATAIILRQLRPLLRDLDVRLLLKTHEEITTFEIVRLIEAVGDDTLGVALDPVNLLCRIEDPVEATKRVAPHVRLVHLDDAVLRFEEGGMRRFLCPIGAGVIDWASILTLVPDAQRVLEFHSGQFAMPVFDKVWRRAQPDLTLDEYASVLAFAAQLPADFVPSDQANSTSRLAPALDALSPISALNELSEEERHADQGPG